MKAKKAENQNSEAKTMIDNAYHQIKQMIMRRQVIPGQRLVYRDLSEALDMSRTPIINALYRLEREGYLVSEAYRGFYVKPIDIQEAWDLYGVREALEVYAIEQAIEKAEPSDIRKLEDKMKTHADYMPHAYDRKKFAIDADFHLEIARISGNARLVKMLKENFDHVNLRFRVFSRIVPGRMEIAIDHHKELLKSMKRKDIIRSIDLIRNHIRSGRDVCITSLTQDESSEEDSTY